MLSQVTLRPVAGGNRQDFIEFMKAVARTGLNPVVDKKVFSMLEAREAYAHMVCLMAISNEYLLI